MSDTEPSTTVVLTPEQADEWYNETHGDHFPKRTWSDRSYCAPCDELMRVVTQ